MHLCFLALLFFFSSLQYMNFCCVFFLSFSVVLFQWKRPAIQLCEIVQFFLLCRPHRYLDHKEWPKTFHDFPVSQNLKNSSYFFSEISDFNSRLCCRRCWLFFAQIQIINIDKQFSKQMFIEFQIRYFIFSLFPRRLSAWLLDSNGLVMMVRTKTNILNAFFGEWVSEKQQSNGMIMETCFFFDERCTSLTNLIHFFQPSIHPSWALHNIKQRRMLWCSVPVQTERGKIENNSHTLIYVEKRLTDWLECVIFFLKIYSIESPV